MPSDAGSIPAASMNVVSNFKMKKNLIGFLAFFISIQGFLFSQTDPFIKLSVRDYSDFSRVFIESSEPLRASTEMSGSYIMVRVRADNSFRIHQQAFQSNRVKSVEWVKGSDYYVFTIKTVDEDFDYEHSFSRHSSIVFIDVNVSSDENGESPNNLNSYNAERNSNSSSHAAQEEELKTIVIDPGHGGLELGAEGRFGTQEKTITLQIALKLKKIIERNLPYRVQLTREEDVVVSLDRRAAIANNYKASVFISIHANGSYRKTARGSETFFLSLNATDEETRRLAYMENNSTELESIQSDHADDIKLILWDMAQSSYIRQSSILAEKIQTKLNTLSGTFNRGVKQAPFKVLTGVACPAVLVETAFISNPEEEKKLATDEFQSSIARAIYLGLEEFLEGYTH
jgi:N-acetylmuramoyl-L-alanine amidase